MGIDTIKKFTIFLVAGLLTVLIIVSIRSLFIDEQPSTQFEVLNERDLIKIVEQTIPFFQSQWRYPKVKFEKLDCTKELGNPLINKNETVFARSYLFCNPNYFQCFLEGNTDKNPWKNIEYKGRKLKVGAIRKFSSPKRYKEEKRFYKIISRSQDINAPVDYGIMVNFVVQEQVTGNILLNKSIPIIFEDSCSDTYLPKWEYKLNSYPRITQEKYLQETEFMYKENAIYVDKFLVSIRDIIEWYDFIDKEIPFPVPEDPALWSMPVLNLKLYEMDKYCRFKGKEHLHKFIFEISTALPIYQNKSKTKVALCSPYPWELRWKNSFLYKSLQGEKINFTKRKCRKAFVKECNQILENQPFQLTATSWMGVHGSLGGEMEVFASEYGETPNLKVSSKHLSSNSVWHHSGLYGFWDGDGFSLNHFSFDKNSFGWTVNDPSFDHQELGVGFRCMKVIK